MAIKPQFKINEMTELIDVQQEQPMISTFQPFDYKEMLSEAKYMFVHEKCGNQGIATLPVVIIGETDDMMNGYLINTYGDGIEINGKISMPKSELNNESLTVQVNQGLCDWLKNYGEQNLIHEVTTRVYKN